jgi:WXG100 family type VII secretion target
LRLGEIVVNQTKVNAVAKDIIKCADRVRELKDQIKDKSANLENNWVGLSKQAYNDLVIKWNKQADTLITELNQIGNTIKTTAEKYKKADEAAANTLNKYI